MNLTQKKYLASTPDKALEKCKIRFSSQVWIIKPIQYSSYYISNFSCNLLLKPLQNWWFSLSFCVDGSKIEIKDKDKREVLSNFISHLWTVLASNELQDRNFLSFSQQFGPPGFGKRHSKCTLNEITLILVGGCLISVLNIINVKLYIHFTNFYSISTFDNFPWSLCSDTSVLISRL